MKTVFGAACAIAAMSAVAPAWAQDASAPPPCAGEYQMIRHSRVKPGQMDLFLKAARDQQAWYASHGMSDRITVGRPLETGAGLSSATAMTVHSARNGVAQRPATAGDAGWNAFVAEYRQAADIADESLVCVTPAG